MKKTIPFLLTAILAGCGPTETPENKNLPTVEELVSDPVYLKELRQQCKTDRVTLGDELCNRVVEATRKRFYNDGTVPYTPPENTPKF
ncbi:entry exclusion lipoprotein TrbK [Pseudomonas aeruginosa]|uniref:entry exclusion lipoprotein TrbK n=1 Tax=Pseudomonas aeruginosa TaxID=287 RepID=UPI003D2CADCE